MTATEYQKPLWTVGDELIPPVKLYKFELGEIRYYYTRARKITFYVSCTSLCKLVLPTSPYLIDWMISTPDHKEYAAEQAHYGNIMHNQQQSLLIREKWTVDEGRRFIKRYIDQENLNPSLQSGWVRRLEHDMLAFKQWIDDVNFRPIAIEYPIIGSRYKIGGKIDLVGEVDIPVKDYWGEVYKSGKKKGEPKATKKNVTYRAIIDQKSGRKGFYYENELQLAIYKRIWNEHFSNRCPIDKVFNWSPKDWRSNPGYNFTDQTDKVGNKELLTYLRLIKIKNLDKPTKTILRYNEIEVGKETEWEKLSIEEMITNKFKNNALATNRIRARARRRRSKPSPPKGRKFRASFT